MGGVVRALERFYPDKPDDRMIVIPDFMRSKRYCKPRKAASTTLGRLFVSRKLERIEQEMKRRRYE